MTSVPGPALGNWGLFASWLAALLSDVLSLANPVSAA